jgi:GH25 family lysozyme M1 (1,4-beta-N-acetylmuramidase)
MRWSAPAVLVSVVLLVAGIGAAQTGPTLPGIDVSHHQGSIDWPAVAADGTRFSFIKATEGRTFTDPNYATNRAAAAAAGVKVAAYHFARPDTDPGDPQAEADHLVDVAQVDTGNVVPALDMEVTGGLGPPALISWTRAFLERVLSRTGIRPAIYASPNFWTNALADTGEFAAAGYPLWIAHWGVSSPTVPAGNWGGRGWTFWQWTNCDQVAGISGCVDGDRFLGTDLAPVTVHVLSAQTTGAGSVTSGDARLDCGAVCRVTYGPGSDVTLTATPAPGGSFVGWGGDCLGTVPACTLRMDVDRTVTAAFSGTPAGTLALSPTASSARGGQAASLTATLTDANGQPVQGSQVSFAVTGANEAAGSTPTDASGQATFVYTGYHPGADTVTAEANGARGTASVSWQGCPGYSSDPRSQIVGTPGNDELTPSVEASVICGLGGNDTLRGATGNDVLLGGDGDDVLVGGGEDDDLRGGAGADRLYAQDGNDFLDGDEGDDYLSAGPGDDVLTGGPGNDRLYAAGGADRIYGEDGADYMSAWTGDDLVSGGAGNDAMAGGSGNDRMVGGPGADRMYGQDGTDRLYAKDGEADRVSAGPGADVCSADRGDVAYGCETRT